MPGTLLLTNATIVTLGPTPEVIAGGAIWIENGKIRAFGKSEEVLAQAPPVSKLDLQSRVVMPGQINAHDHLYSAFARGISLKDEAPANFLQILQRLWWRLDQALSSQDCYLSSLLGFTEAVQRGVTTVVDHHASPACIDGSLDRLAEAAQQVGLRACLCYETTDRHGEAGARQGVMENLRFARHCQSSADGRLAAALGLHASITVDSRTLSLALTEWPEDVPVHVHVAEDMCDVEHSLKTYGRPPLQRLLEEGLKDRPVWAAHCIHLQPHEKDLLAVHGVTVMHNPRSNMNNAVGCAPVQELLERGVPVALGTDGMSQDPAEDARALAVIHKHQAADPRGFAWENIYRVAFLEPARLASARFGRKLGVIEVGAEADLMVLDYDPPTPLTGGNFLGHWLFGMGTAPVWGTWVAGDCVFFKGQVAGVDAADLKARCRAAAENLWERW
ncbi:putative aminohydrolase SsnA [bacterium]|nr:putative aminohydrolase SsnA [bacterium]